MLSTEKVTFLKATFCFMNFKLSGYDVTCYL
jgi:hypothetical protein